MTGRWFIKMSKRSWNLFCEQTQLQRKAAPNGWVCDYKRPELHGRVQMGLAIRCGLLRWVATVGQSWTANSKKYAGICLLDCSMVFKFKFIQKNSMQYNIAQQDQYT